MKKDRLSCLLRSLRNQPPRTRERFLERRVSVIMRRAAEEAFGYLSAEFAGLRIKVATPPKTPYSVTYDLIITEEL